MKKNSDPFKLPKPFEALDDQDLADFFAKLLNSKVAQKPFIGSCDSWKKVE